MNQELDLIIKEVDADGQFSDRQSDLLEKDLSKDNSTVANYLYTSPVQEQDTQHVPYIIQEDARPIKILGLSLLLILTLILIGSILIDSHHQLDTVHHTGEIHSLVQKHLISMKKPPKRDIFKLKNKNAQRKSSKQSKDNSYQKSHQKPKINQSVQHSKGNLALQQIKYPPQTSDNTQISSFNQNKNKVSDDFYLNYQKYLDLDYDKWKKNIDPTKYQSKAGISWEKFQNSINQLLIPDYYTVFIDKDQLKNKQVYERVRKRNDQIELGYKEDKAWFQSNYSHNTSTPSQSTISHNHSFCVVVSPKSSTSNTAIIRATHTIQSLYNNQNLFNSTIVYSGVFAKDSNHQLFKKFQGIQFPQHIYVQEQKDFKAEFVNAESYQTKTQTIYRAIHEYCHQGQIVLLVDEGDAIISRYLISVLIQQYQRKLSCGDTPLLVYTQNIIVDPIKQQFSVGNSNFYQEQFYSTNSFRKLHKLNVAPLVSFKRQLFLRIDPQDLKSKSGKFYEKVTDQAIIYPLLEMAGPRIKYIEEIMYQVFDQRTDTQRRKDSLTYKNELIQFYQNKVPYKKISNVQLTEEQYKDIQKRYQLEKKAYKLLENQETLALLYEMKQQMSLQRQKLVKSHLHNYQDKSDIKKQSQKIIKPNNKPVNNLYNFNLPVRQMINQANQNYQFDQKKNITSQQIETAIRRLWINHRVNIYGKIVDDLHSQHIKQTDSSVKNQKPSAQQIQQTINQQYIQFDAKYNISSYHSINQQLRFCIVVPSFQNAHNNLLYRNLDSIFMQNYTNYHVVYVDDHSPDKTGQEVLKYIKRLQIPQSKIKVIINDKNYGAMYSIYHGITNFCGDNQIVVMVDGDDALVGMHVLAVLNALFHQQKLLLLYSQYLKITENSKVSIGNCHSFIDRHFAENSFRTVQDARVSHLKVFYVKLFKKIKIEDLTYDGKHFYQATSDRAILTPMLEMANPRFHYLSQILYEYRYDTGINGNFVHKSQQRKVKNLLEKKQKYQSIGQLEF